MRLRTLIVILGLTAASCSAGGPAPQSADRSVGGEWDAEAAILRTQIVENALEGGLTRTQSRCMLDEIDEAIPLERLAELDLSATAGSGASSDEAALLGPALGSCGPSIDQMLEAAAPGASTIPASHESQAACLRTSYREGIIGSYTDRFESRDGTGRHIVDIRVPLQTCEAAGALLLGASHNGHVETGSLSTVEWGCLVNRLPASVFVSAFPFPDDVGDARVRLGSSIDADVAYCEAWVAGTPIPG